MTDITTPANPSTTEIIVEPKEGGYMIECRTCPCCGCEDLREEVNDDDMLSCGCRSHWSVGAGTAHTVMDEDEQIERLVKLGL